MNEAVTSCKGRMIPTIPIRDLLVMVVIWLTANAAEILTEAPALQLHTPPFIESPAPNIPLKVNTSSIHEETDYVKVKSYPRQPHNKTKQRRRHKHNDRHKWEKIAEDILHHKNNVEGLSRTKLVKPTQENQTNYKDEFVEKQQYFDKNDLLYFTQNRSHNKERKVKNDLGNILQRKNYLTSEEIDIEKNIAAIFRNAAFPNRTTYHKAKQHVKKNESRTKSYKRKKDKSLNKYSAFLDESIRPQVINFQKTKPLDRLVKVKRNSSPRPNSRSNDTYSTADFKIPILNEHKKSALLSELRDEKDPPVTSNSIKTNVTTAQNLIGLENGDDVTTISLNYSTTSKPNFTHIKITTNPTNPISNDFITAKINILKSESLSMTKVAELISSTSSSLDSYTSSSNEATTPRPEIRQRKDVEDIHPNRSVQHLVAPTEESTTLSWLGLFFTHYRNVFWMTVNSIFLIITFTCAMFSLYRLIWLQWCSALISRTFYLVIHLLAFTSAAFLSVQLLHLLLGSDEGLPLILTLMLVHTPASCLIVTLWFIIYCILSSARLNFYGEFMPTPNQLAISSSILILGSFMCDIVTGATHSIWFLLLSRLIICMMAVIPEIMYLLKINKINEVLKLLKREFQGELKLLVVPVNDGEISEQSDVKFLLRDRLQRWSSIVFYCSIIGISMLLSNCVLSIFFTFSHVSIILWWFFHGITCLTHYALIAGIIIASACTLQNETQNSRNLVMLLYPPRTIHKAPPKSTDSRNCTYERVPFSNVVNSPIQTSVPSEEHEDQYNIRNNSVTNPTIQEFRPRSTIKRSATFNCDAQRLMYRRYNHAIPSYHMNRQEMHHPMIQELRPAGSAVLVHEQGFVRFRTPMELNNPNIEYDYNYSNNFDDVNLYQSRSETGYGTLKALPLKPYVAQQNESENSVRNIPLTETNRPYNYYPPNIQPQYRLHCQTKFVYSPMHVVRHPLNRNSSFTVPQSALKRSINLGEANSPYLMKSRVFENSIGKITPYSHANLHQGSNPSLTTFKPGVSNNTSDEAQSPVLPNVPETEPLNKSTENESTPKVLYPTNMNIVTTASPVHSNSSGSTYTSTKLSPRYESRNHTPTNLPPSPCSSSRSTPKLPKSNLQTNTNHYPSINKELSYISPKCSINSNLYCNSIHADNKLNMPLDKLGGALNLSSIPVNSNQLSKINDETAYTNSNSANDVVINKDIPATEDSYHLSNLQTSSSVSSHSDSCTDNATDTSLQQTDLITSDNEDISPDSPRQITDKAPSLKRNHSTAGCYASPRRQSSFHRAIENENNFEFAKPNSKNEKYPWYGTWGGRRKSRKGLQNIAEQFQSSLVSLQNQPKILSSSRASLVSLYGKLKLKSRRRSTAGDCKDYEGKDSEEVSCSSTADDEHHDVDETASEGTVSNSQDISEEEESDSIDKMSVDWTLEMIKSSELLAGFYALEAKDDKEPESHGDEIINNDVYSNTNDS